MYEDSARTKADAIITLILGPTTKARLVMDGSGD